MANICSNWRESLKPTLLQTHSGHSPVRDEACCEAAQKAPDLQGTHVWATYEDKRSHSQEITSHWNSACVKGRASSIPHFHTHECRLALVLNEEELAPVGAGRLHPEHHQVGHRQQPEVGRQQELRQGALITGRTWSFTRCSVFECVCDEHIAATSA